MNNTKIILEKRLRQAAAAVEYLTFSKSIDGEYVAKLSISFKSNRDNNSESRSFSTTPGFDIPWGNEPGDAITDLRKSFWLSRIDKLKEEYMEFCKSIAENDTVEFVDSSSITKIEELDNLLDVPFEDDVPF